jgi:hypothetical protein
MTALQNDRHEQNQRAHYDRLPHRHLPAADDDLGAPHSPNQMTMSEKEAESLKERIRQWIRYTEDTAYLRRKHEALLNKIGGGDTDANHQGDAQPGLAGQQADTDDFKWEPRSDCS